jgi:hypothetical protein
METNAKVIIYNHEEKRLIFSSTNPLCNGAKNITIEDLLWCVKNYPKDAVVAIRIEENEYND